MASLVCFLFGFKDVAEAQTLTPFKFSEISNKWGYQDSLGRTVVYWHFDEAGPFNQWGNAIVGYKKKYGLINKNGFFIIPPRYTSIYQKSQDTIFVPNDIIKRMDSNYYYSDFDNIWTNVWAETGPPNILRFSYPKDAEFVAVLKRQQLEKDGNSLQTAEEDDLQGFATLNVSTNVDFSNTTGHQFAMLSFEYMFGKKLMGDNFRFGIGTAFGRSIVWSDSVYKSNVIALGIIQQINLTDKVSLNLKTFPVVSRDFSTRPREQFSFSKRTNAGLTLKVLVGGNLVYTVDDVLLLSIGFQSIPTLSEKTWEQQGYFKVGFGLKLK